MTLAATNTAAATTPTKPTKPTTLTSERCALRGCRGQPDVGDYAGCSDGALHREAAGDGLYAWNQGADKIRARARARARVCVED